jgi:hypothetical protein
MAENRKPTHEPSIGEIITMTFSLYSEKFIQYLIPFIITGAIVGILTMAIDPVITVPVTVSTTTQEALAGFAKVLAATLVSSIIVAFIQPILPIALTLYYYSMIARTTPQEPTIANTNCIATPKNATKQKYYAQTTEC